MISTLSTKLLTADGWHPVRRLDWLGFVHDHLLLDEDTRRQTLPFADEAWLDRFHAAHQAFRAAASQLEPSRMEEPPDRDRDGSGGRSGTLERGLSREGLPPPPFQNWLCPITMALMRDPVMFVADGQTYERSAIETWLSGGKRTSPVTNEALTSTEMVPNHALRGAIDEWVEAQRKAIEARAETEAELADLMTLLAPPAGDLAAELYVALLHGPGAAMVIVAAAKGTASWVRRSEWTERRQRRRPGGGHSWVWLDIAGREVPEGDVGVAKATKGLSALHVLARDCADPAVAAAAVAKAGGAALLEAKGEHSMLPIHFAAAQSSSVEVVHVLLDAGGVGQLAAKADGGWLPMHCAARSSSSVNVVRVLLEVGGTVQLAAKANDGRLPLHCAAMHSTSPEVVRLLLGKRGAGQLLAKDKSGRTPQDCSQSQACSAEVARLLLEAGDAVTAALAKACASPIIPRATAAEAVIDNARAEAEADFHSSGGPEAQLLGSQDNEMPGGTLVYVPGKGSGAQSTYAHDAVECRALVGTRLLKTWCWFRRCGQGFQSKEARGQRAPDRVRWTRRAGQTPKHGHTGLVLHPGQREVRQCGDCAAANVGAPCGRGSGGGGGRVGRDRPAGRRPGRRAVRCIAARAGCCVGGGRSGCGGLGRLASAVEVGRGAVAAAGGRRAGLARSSGQRGAGG